MDAIITAGGTPLPGDPLYEATGGDVKAMVDVAGKPMVQWILDALSEASTIDNVVVVGLTDKMGLTCRKPLAFVSNQGNMVANIRGGAKKVLEIDPAAEYVLIVSSDIPAITGEMADWVVTTCMETKLDVYYNLIQREVMEKRFPGSKRTWTPLKDMEVCGGDMNVGRIGLILEEGNDMWDKITATRKSPLKQAALIGFGTAFKLLTHNLTLAQAEHDIMKRLKITGRAIVCPYAEVGMDVDKPHQLEIMRADLQKRVKKAEKAGKEAASRKNAKKTAKKPAKKAAPGKAAAKKAAPVKSKASPKKPAPKKAPAKISSPKGTPSPKGKPAAKKKSTKK